jgi:hypothetical protein
MGVTIRYRHGTAEDLGDDHFGTHPSDRTPSVAHGYPPLRLRGGE